MKIRTKLTVGFIVVVSLIWITVFVASNTYTEIHEKFEVLERDIVPGAIAMSEMETRAHAIKAWTLVYIYRGNVVRIDKTVKEWLQESTGSLEKLAREHGEQAVVVGPEAAKIAEEIESKVKQLSSITREIVSLKDQGTEVDELMEIMEELYYPVISPLLKQVSEHEAKHLAELAESEEAVREANTSGMRILFIVAGLVTVMVVGVRFFIVGPIVKRLQALHKGTEIIGQGNLDYKVGTKAKDEIGQLSRAFDQMTEGLKRTTTSIDNLNKEITERKQAEEILRQSEDKYRKLFELSSDALFLLDTETGMVLALNESAIKQYGYSQEEALQMKNTDFSAEPDKSILAIEESEAFIPLRYHRKKDGTIFPVEISIGYFTWDRAEVCIVAVRDITERKQTEEVLRESKEHYQAMAEAGSRMGEAITIMQDTDTVKAAHLYANEEWARITGYTIEELREISYIDLIHPQYQAAVAERIRRRLQGEDILGHWEISIIAKDGTEVPIEVAGGVYILRQGKPAIIGYIRDITERKLAEEALRENEQRYIHAEKLGQFGHWHRDFIDDEANWSAGAYEIFGVRPEQFKPIQENIYNLIHPDDRQVVKRMRDDATLKGKKFDIKYRIIRHDGEERVLHSVADVYDDKNGRPRGLFGTVIDITERKQAEEALTQSEEKFRALVETTNDFIWEIDVTGAYTYCSPQMEKLWGLKPEEMLGKTPFHLLPTEDKEQAIEGFSALLKSSSSFSGMETQSLDGTGRIIWLEISGVPFYDTAGKLRGYRGISRDITERKQIEEQLQHSQVLASLGEMTAGISHEVNNPLGSVLLYSELLLKSGVPRQTRKDLRIIHNEAKRAAKIMTDLLAYSRKLTLHMRRSNLHSILKKALDMRRYEEKVQNISVSTNRLDGPLYIRGDSSQLTQVFLNLLLNAEEALQEQKGGNIKVTTETDGEWAKVSIADDGPGIPEDKLSQVFHPFFTTKKVGEGTGLGLSTCYGIITAHNGLIRVENNDNGGATFTVEIPLAGKGRQGILPLETGETSPQSHNENR